MVWMSCPEALGMLCSLRVSSRPTSVWLRWVACLWPPATCEDPARPLSWGPTFLRGKLAPTVGFQSAVFPFLSWMYVQLHKCRLSLQEGLGAGPGRENCSGNAGACWAAGSWQEMAAFVITCAVNMLCPVHAQVSCCVCDCWQDMTVWSPGRAEGHWRAQSEERFLSCI